MRDNTVFQAFLPPNLARLFLFQAVRLHTLTPISDKFEGLLFVYTVTTPTGRGRYIVASLTARSLILELLLPFAHLYTGIPVAYHVPIPFGRVKDIASFTDNLLEVNNYQSLNRSINPSIHQSLNQSKNQSISAPRYRQHINTITYWTTEF